MPDPPNPAEGEAGRPPATAEGDFDELLSYLRQARGVDFASYKRPTMARRVAKRLQATGVDTFAEYTDYLQVHGEEFGHLFDTVLINVTSFFRDGPAWEYLAREVVPKLVSSRRGDEPIRVWCAGCASGQEAYSLAMVFAEAMGEEQFVQAVKIYATDIDEDALLHARQGYTVHELEGVSEDLRTRYFEPQGGRYLFRTALRRALIFGRHDLLRDAPISRLDLLSCRNTLMYLTAEAQDRVLAQFHYALNENGRLFLGRAEMLLTHGDLFSPIDLKQRVFTRVGAPQNRDRLLPVPTASPAPSGNASRQVRLKEAARDLAPAPQIVVDAGGVLILANQAARTLFNLSFRDVGRPLRDLEVSYRPLELRSQLERVQQERRPVMVGNVVHDLGDGNVRYFDVQVIPINYDDGTLLGFSAAFTDVTVSRLLHLDLERTKQEVETAHEELQSSYEELETTNEELQSTVEELETTNEELQSSNEELETMNEELESTNGELQAINGDLGQRTNELDRVNVFMQSILTSVRSGVAVLDEGLRVQLWNQRAEDLWGLRDAEVIDQPFLRLDIGLPVSQLHDLIQSGLGPASELMEQVVEATTRRGKRIQCRVTTTPLVAPNGVAHGVVVLMEELAAP